MGAVIRDYRSGRLILAIRYRDVDGRFRKERTKASNEAVARRILADRENAVERALLQGLNSIDDVVKPRQIPTVRQFMIEYKDHLKVTCKPSTYRRCLSAIDGKIVSHLGSHTLRSLNAGEIQKYSDMRLAVVKPATVRHELMILSGMFREAVKRELIPANPLRLVNKPRVQNEVIRYLDPEEEERLIGIAPEPLKTAIVVAIHSGMRDGEQRSLMWNDVRSDEGVIVVRESKSGKPRRIPMNRPLREAIESIEQYPDSPYVFTNPATRKPYDRFNNTTWRRILGKAGIQDFRWHDLRHTFGSRLAQAGVPITAIRDLLGHSQIQVTMRYAHLAPSNLRDAVQKLDPKPAKTRRVAK